MKRTALTGKPDAAHQKTNKNTGAVIYEYTPGGWLRFAVRGHATETNQDRQFFGNLCWNGFFLE